MNTLELVKLGRLMELTEGTPAISIGLIDGPVALHRDLSGAQRILAGGIEVCKDVQSRACSHGTFITGILSASRGSAAPGLCPACELLIRPIFNETDRDGPESTPEELAVAMRETVDAGARIINISASHWLPLSQEHNALKYALDYVLSRGTIVVAATGNQGIIGTSPITRHPWVIPVAACNSEGQPMSQSNFGRSSGRRGISAPGEKITSLGPNRELLTFTGTSAATPFVTGTIALIWSLFPSTSAADIRRCFIEAHRHKFTTVVPPLLDAWAAYQGVKNILEGGNV
jgi:subtilisin family serine protease